MKKNFKEFLPTSSLLLLLLFAFLSTKFNILTMNTCDGMIEKFQTWNFTSG
jgi:hypothetical protein